METIYWQLATYHGFDPSQETFDEYLRRLSLEG